MRARPYLAFARLEIKSSLSFLPDVLAGLSFFVVVMFVFFQLWETTFSVAGSKTVNGYTLREMMWYLVATESIVLSMPRTYREISNDVRTGDLAVKLLRPMNYLVAHWSTFLGSSLFRFGAGLLLGGGVTWMMAGPPPVERASALLVLPLLFLTTFSLHFSLSALVGLAAFWVEDVWGLWLVVDKVKWLLGGLLMPLEVFPDWLRPLTNALPFRHMLHAPARLFVKFSWSDVGSVFAGQIPWLMALAALLWFVNARGIRRVTLNGG